MVPHWLREIAFVLCVGGLAAGTSLVLSASGPSLADEFVYLAGGLRFANTNSLESTYYYTDAILSVGHPHQDAHSPGYVMILGVVNRILGPGSTSAVALNVVSLLISLGLLWSLALHLGRPRIARLLTASAVAIPALLPYTSWVMPEWPVAASSLGALWVAVLWGERPFGAILAGLALGACVFIRESGIFLVPVLILLVGLSWFRLSLFVSAFLTFGYLVWVPLNAARPPVATAPVSGSAGNTTALRALREGRIATATSLFADRAKRNLSALPHAGYEQQCALLLSLLLPAFAWVSWGESTPRARSALVGLSVGLVSMIAVTVLLSDLVGWNGPRYWTILVIAFYALLPEPVRGVRRLALCLLVILSAVVTVSVLFTFREFKSRGSSTNEVVYFDRYAPPGSYSRVIWQNGYKLGIERYPAEVIVSIPQTRKEYRALERALWFDYVVLSTWQNVLDADGHYALVNTADPDPLVKIFRRLR